MIAPDSASSLGSHTRLAVALLAGVMSIGVMAVTKASPSRFADMDAPRLAVQYDDLDVNTEEGALTLYRRIVSAAREVCPQESKYSMRVTEISRQCVRNAVARAVREVNSPQLAKVDAAHASKRSSSTKG